jgi:hypothetical protein
VEIKLNKEEHDALIASSKVVASYYDALKD